jgi:6-phosphofructokinase 1
MGRYCGYIAVNATLASRDVNICLIPEVHFQLYGPDGVYQRIIERA